MIDANNFPTLSQEKGINVKIIYQEKGIKIFNQERGINGKVFIFNIFSLKFNKNVHSQSCFHCGKST